MFCEHLKQRKRFDFEKEKDKNVMKGFWNDKNKNKEDIDHRNNAKNVNMKKKIIMNIQ